jgi:hypothetical protein
MRIAAIAKWSSCLILLALHMAVVSAQTPAKTATQFYMDYRAAFEKATKVEDVIPFMSAEVRKQIEATPAAERPEMFQMIKMMNVTGVKVTREQITSTGATLTAEGTDSDKKKSTGTVQILKENGAWKLGQESWTSS